MRTGGVISIAASVFLLLCGCAHDYPVSLQPAYPTGQTPDNALAKVKPPLRLMKGMFTDRRADSTVLVRLEERAHSYTLRARRPLDETLFEGLGTMLRNSGHSWGQTDSNNVRIDMQLLNIQASGSAGLPGLAELITASAASAVQVKLDFVNARTGERIYSQVYTAQGARGPSTAMMGMLDRVTASIGAAIVDVADKMANDEQLATALQKITASATLDLAEAQESSIPAQASKSVVRILSVAEAEGLQPLGPPEFSRTGVLISADGHVVSDALSATRTEAIVAIFPDGRRYTGSRLGVDQFSNLALFKLAGQEHEPAPLRVSNDLRDGDSVYAIVATPDGARLTVKARVLNARRFATPRDAPTLPYIEIEDNKPDTPIQDAIFDERGSLVGFVTLRSGPGQKTKFVLATPTEDVTRIAHELRVAGRVRRSRIGVGVDAVSKDLATARALAEPTGALIGWITKGSPADRAGLAVGDIIVRMRSSFHSTVVRSPNDYMAAMERIRAGMRIHIEVLGAGGPRLVSLTTGEIVSGAPVGELAPDSRKSIPSD